MDIDSIIIAVLVFLLFFGMPIFEWIVKYRRKRNTKENTTEISYSHFGSSPHSIYQKETDVYHMSEKIKDADMCLLRDLYSIAFSNDGPQLGATTTNVIAKITKGIDSTKIEKAMQIAPELVEDVFPTDYESKKEYLFNLLEVWKHSGYLNKKNTLLYIQHISNRMGLSDKDYLHIYQIVRDYDPLD